METEELQKAHERGLDLAYETGWFRGRIDATIALLEKDCANITLKDKINIAIAGLREALDDGKLSEAVSRHREFRKLSANSTKN